ncbi:MAG TPA: hypothetical protein VH370_09980 [Humisphaera sp.]|jgi:predicted RNase H-like HicB family nuclease|nr:hypothetical protein [Humisphaera sp.]
MRYTVVLEPTNEPDQPGWYYAHIPTLDLTTHGLGVEGALAAAKDLVAGWIAELAANGEVVPQEGQGFVSQIEVPENALHGA